MKRMLPVALAASAQSLETGRVFVCYLRWSCPAKSTAAGTGNGRELPCPDAPINRLDPRDRLRAWDTGSKPVLPQ